jgi:hypothetical protein
MQTIKDIKDNQDIKDLKEIINKNLNSISTVNLNKILLIINREHKLKDLEEQKKLYDHKKQSTTVRYKLLMKILNIIVKNLNKKPILLANEFININRLDIIHPKNLAEFTLLIPEIFKHFDKTKCGYYNLNTERVILNTIRSMCKIMKIRLIPKQFNRAKQQKTVTSLIYTII